MTKIFLVTGGAGFIGSHLTARLLANGSRGRVLDNFSTGSLANLPFVSATTYPDQVPGAVTHRRTQHMHQRSQGHGSVQEPGEVSRSAPA